jgi:hypothetical protein
VTAEIRLEANPAPARMVSQSEGASGRTVITISVALPTSSVVVNPLTITVKISILGSNGRGGSAVLVDVSGDECVPGVR